MEHSDQHVDPENPKHAHCEMTAECVEHVRWDVFSLQELWTDTCNMGPCIFMLQPEVIVALNGPQHLVTASLCIQIAHNITHTCSLPPLCSQRLHQQTAQPQKALNAVCHLPGTVYTGTLTCRELFSKAPDASEGECLLTQVGSDETARRLRAQSG